MARRSKGPLVFFRRVIQGAAKARPFLKPAGEVGRREMMAALRRGIATMSGKGALDEKSLTNLAAEATRVGAFAALVAAQRKAPVDKGRLRASLNARMRALTYWTVGTNMVYAYWVEKGRRGGKVIRPKRARVLAFHWANAPADVRRRARRRGRARGQRR